MNSTNEFSFVLKPSAHGVGVFVTHDIAEGTKLRLFIEEDQIRSKDSVPEAFLGFCIDRGDTVITPRDFGHLSVGWYMNHSSNPNVVRCGSNQETHGIQWCARRNIKAGEEILADYNQLEEPEEAKKDYYRNT